MNETRHDSPDESNAKQEQKFNFSFKGEPGDALGQGMDALKSVLGGFVNMVKEAIGPEGLRNLEASQWLTQAAACMTEVATGLRERGAVPTGKAGELTCFRERVDAEIRGSKFESQLPSLRQRLDDALQFIEQRSGSEGSAVSERDINRLSDSAGYFNAAAASVVLSGSMGSNAQPKSTN